MPRHTQRLNIKCSPEFKKQLIIFAQKNRVNLSKLVRTLALKEMEGQKSVSI